MKKIINQKRYNTETAQEIGSWDNGEPCNSLNWTRKTLYQKKTGEFFIYAEGGPNTKYCRYVYDQTWAGGATIIPINYWQAEDWALQNLDLPQYKKVFCGQLNDDENVRLDVNISTFYHQKLKNYAAKTGLTQKEIIADLIVKFFR